ncbi:DUF6602 domain-containing protein [Curtobacterium sp. MCSS17_016]|uniref:DUF6602 domain-containing protein n=1 Tax=Curtobacterium sp. MCSS17_016 TaxID=2175644 RepID=UPI0011B47475|nr:DUF6602 domain-containing protein [Curtobacterium sp. MCSS17_016]WIE79247.1 hypothetical protein DEJ19_001420 [Curtobacterium sp. MCSS17_016]
MHKVGASEDPVRNKMHAIFAAEEQKLLAQLNQFRAGFSHNLSKGESAEHAVRSFLVKHMPRRFGVGAGQVFDRWGAETNQLDIILTNDDQPLNHGSHDAGYYLAEGTSGMAEVKTTLTKQTLQDIVKKGQSVRSLTPDPPQKNELMSITQSDGVRFIDSFPFFAVAFETSLAQDRVLALLNEVAPVDISAVRRDTLAPLDALFVLGHGAYVNLADGRGSLSFLWPDGSVGAGWVRIGDDALYALFLWLDAVVQRRYRWHGIATSYLIRMVQSADLAFGDEPTA